MNLKTVRAVRNNNPLNIKIGDHWIGLMPRSMMTVDQLAEDVFAVFETPAKGFRAAGIILRNYQRLHHLMTPRGWISRWAPPPIVATDDKNNTEEYIESVCKANGWEDNQVITFTPTTLSADMHAQSIVEVGAWAFQQADCDQGASEAFA